ncbi:MAG: family 43 glycosylhydrolase [Lachnospiraceae bacterium]
MMMNENLIPGGGFADPHALVEGGKVYIICGSDKSPKTEDTWRMDKWCILCSEDLKEWTKVGEILPSETYIGDKDDHCWAGFNMKKNGKFYWFFSNKYIDTGVVVADQVEGPYVDLLGKPLLPEGFAPTKSYDPCVFDENGVSTIFFGAGHYCCVDLADDLMSTVGESQMVHVYDDDGNEVGTEDKSTVFKYHDKYYLCYGARYAMSDTLKGPYKFMGRFIGGGHNDIFEFNGKMYICNEFHDTSIFYRGIRVMELNFHEDGTVVIPDYDSGDIHYEKTWSFAKHDQNWFMTDMEDCTYETGAISYKLDETLGLRSPVFPGVVMPEDGTLYMTLDNMEHASSVMVDIQTVPHTRGYWGKEYKTQTMEVALQEGLHTYMLPVKLQHDADVLRRIALYGTKGAQGEVLKVLGFEFKIS